MVYLLPLLKLKSREPRNFSEEQKAVLPVAHNYEPCVDSRKPATFPSRQTLPYGIGTPTVGVECPRALPFMPWPEDHPPTAPSPQSRPWAGASGAVELPESAWCCGSAGMHNISQPEMSQMLLRRKMANIATTAAQVVASADPGCSVQIEAAVWELNLKLKVAHPFLSWRRPIEKANAVE
jgi:hypothetical protein